MGRVSSLVSLADGTAVRCDHDPTCVFLLYPLHTLSSQRYSTKIPVHLTTYQAAQHFILFKGLAHILKNNNCLILHGWGINHKCESTSIHRFSFSLWFLSADHLTSTPKIILFHHHLPTVFCSFNRFGYHPYNFIRFP